MRPYMLGLRPIMDVRSMDQEPSFNNAQHDFGLLSGIARDPLNSEFTTYSSPSACRYDHLSLAHEQAVQMSDTDFSCS